MTRQRTTLFQTALLLLYFGLCLLGQHRALAQDAPDVEYFINSPQMVGGEAPTLRITSRDPLEEVTLTLRRQGVQRTYSLGEIRRGQAAEVTFDSPPGTHLWRAELEGLWHERPFGLSFEFDFEMSEGLEITIPVERVDLAGRRLSVLLNRPAARIDYAITRDDGVIIGEGSVPFDGEAPGTPLDLPWSQGDGTVLKITLTAYDTDGFWAEVELIPWSVDIPHEEINFETASAVIPDFDQYKIDDAYRQVLQALDRYGEFVSINLYVAGYTDTVGSLSDNQVLSEQRARSIAQAFRNRGFTAPIFYQGFGETVLAVPTPDETDELANRRALYILAAEPPLPSAQIPRHSWRHID